MKQEGLMGMADEVLAEDMEIIDELIKEDIQPIIDYKKQLQNKQFEKAYKEVLELEGKI